MQLTELLHEWHDFYVLAGTAAATLVGLMFVAASIGAAIFSEQNRAGLQAFLSPTVVQFAAVLVICLLLCAPIRGWIPAGALLGLGGLLGVAYAGAVLRQIVIRRRFKVDLLDRLFYALAPVVGYLVVLGAALLFCLQSPAAADAIAVAILVLLLAGIRNAWDMTVFVVLRTPTAAARDEAPAPSSAPAAPPAP